MRQLKVVSVLLALLVLVACPNNPKPQTLPPGALNQFDATSYESLMGKCLEETQLLYRSSGTDNKSRYEKESNPDEA